MADDPSPDDILFDFPKQKRTDGLRQDPSGAPAPHISEQQLAKLNDSVRVLEQRIKKLESPPRPWALESELNVLADRVHDVESHAPDQPMPLLENRAHRMGWAAWVVTLITAAVAGGAAGGAAGRFF